MQKIKDAAKRISALAGAMALLLGIGTSMVPISVASADALNPLTERSLTLSSSSPGYHYLDAAGNPTYAPAGSGNNGKQTGEVLTFRVSSDATIKAFTMQYCTSPAGSCLSPGDNFSKHADHTDSADSTDLSINFPSPSQGTVTPGATQHSSTNNFQIFTGGTQQNGGTATTATDWVMTLTNVEDSASYAAGEVTGRDNFITFTSATGQHLTPNEEVSIVLYGTDTNYITNPGSGAFFVKVNTFNSDTVQNTAVDTPTNGQPATIVDGGVTVANVMNDSIQIQTKVLETMSFSVGTTNPDADSTIPNGSHGTCHTIDKNDPINLGDPSAEYSLRTTRAYDGYSYWRLSSNSSNGAIVYYSGYSLTNTENDHIKAISSTTGDGDNTPNVSVPGSEQFGLAVEAPNANDTDGVINRGERSADTLATGAVSLGALTPLAPTTGYGTGEGLINGGSDGLQTNTALFTFDTASLYVPRAIAQETTDVIHCSTARMRYIANIAPDTPAGIYTSKINYIASPEY